MKKTVIFVFIVLVGLVSVDATVYSDDCSLAHALLDNGMPRDQLENWVCLVESESSGNTAAKGGPNSDGSYDYGLYQINNRYWCREGYAGGGCNINCYDLLNDDISDDTKCAKLIYDGSGYDAWFGWQYHCKNKQLPDLSNCGL